MKQKVFILLMVFGLSTLTVTLSSCNKSTCPTYAGSGSNKQLQKKNKKSGNAPYNKKYNKKNQKTKQGKPMSGL